MAEQVVLVLTQQFDPTADLVIHELNNRCFPVVRLDVAEFPESLVMHGRIGPEQHHWNGLLSNARHTVRLADIRSVWYRRPTRFMLHPELSSLDRVWVQREARAGFGGVLGALRCRWVNHPMRNSLAESKPLQLALAAQCGLTVPPTLITNDPGAARDFVAVQENGAIYKPLSGSPCGQQDPPMALYTSPVTPQEITGGVTRTAHLFQSQISKEFEVRLTVVGDHQFAVRIDALSKKARLDWRADYDNLAYRPIEIPQQISDGVRRLMTSLGLAYGALDFIVDPEGCWHFIEINPNGQWGWIELATGLPITQAIADLLER